MEVTRSSSGIGARGRAVPRCALPCRALARPKAASSQRASASQPTGFGKGSAGAQEEGAFSATGLLQSLRPSSLQLPAMLTMTPRTFCGWDGQRFLAQSCCHRLWGWRSHMGVTRVIRSESIAPEFALLAQLSADHQIGHRGSGSLPFWQEEGSSMKHLGGPFLGTGDKKLGE